MGKFDIAINLSANEYNNFLTFRNKSLDEDSFIENVQIALERYKKSKAENAIYANLDLNDLKNAAVALVNRENKIKKLKLRESRVAQLIQDVYNSIEVNQATTIEKLAKQIKEKYPYYCAKRKGRICLPIGLAKEVLIRLCLNGEFLNAAPYYIRIK